MQEPQECSIVDENGFKQIEKQALISQKELELMKLKEESV